MPTAPVTTTVSGAAFSVNVAAANLDVDSALVDYLVLENGILTANPNSYVKTTAGTVLQYAGVSLPSTTLEVRRRTPRLLRVAQSVGTKIRSNDWNNEFDRLLRIAEEYDLYGAGGGFSVRLPLDAPFSAAWDGDTLFPPTRNAIYDEVVLKANINSPTFTGTPTAPTATTADNSTALATTAHVKANLGSYAPLASPALTGVPTAPTALTADNGTTVATTAHVKANLAAYLTLATASSTYAPLASPALTGTPTAPTAARTVNSTQLATTQYVRRSLRPVCILSRITSPQAIAINTPTILVFNNKIRDVDNAYDSATGIFTAPYTGYYRFTAFVRSNAVSCAHVMYLTSGGSDIGRMSEIVQGATTTPIAGSVEVYLTGGGTCSFSVFASAAHNVTNESSPSLRSSTNATISYLGDDV